MLKQLKLSNVGPAATMELKFGPRLNLITGDNGLGKSFFWIVEPVFDAKKDAWFDLDLENNEVVLRQRPFEPMGDASSWLTSIAFGPEG